jgi:hypothetical protein
VCELHGTHSTHSHVGPAAASALFSLPFQLRFKDEQGEMAHEQMLLPNAPVTEWAFVGKGALGALLTEAGFASMQALRDANLDDFTEEGPVRRLGASVDTVRTKYPTIGEASWPLWLMPRIWTPQIASSVHCPCAGCTTP